jgi:hypothetical protein
MHFRLLFPESEAKFLSVTKSNSSNQKKKERKMKTRNYLFMVLAAVSLTAAQYAAWSNSAVIRISGLSDYEIAGSVTDFPIVVRLDAGSFNFSEAKSGGEDVRFSSGGTPLAYAVEIWDATAEMAAVWVMMPTIGQDAQDITIHWGNTTAASESDGSAVFQTSNGFAGVWHLGADLLDATSNNNDGTNNGTESIAGAWQVILGVPQRTIMSMSMMRPVLIRPT